MTETLAEPPTPPDANLTDFPFTPIFRARLFASRFHARATDTEWRAGVTLWLKSWDQVPAGSLPDDDIDLCRLAELGRDLKKWKKIKAGALHGWTKRADGLLYHETVADCVNEAWDRKRKQHERGKKGAASRWNKRTDAVQQALPDDALSMHLDMPKAMLTDGNRQGQGQGQGQGESKTSLCSAKKTDPRGIRLPEDWNPGEDGARFALGLGLVPRTVFAKFRDYWLAKPGKEGRKLDWQKTWQNWCRGEAERKPRQTGPVPAELFDRDAYLRSPITPTNNPL